MTSKKPSQKSFLDWLLPREGESLPLPLKRRSEAHTIRASEIGTFIYCHRAWWYEKQGETNENRTELLTGSRLHILHGREVLKARLMRLTGYLLLLAAVVLLTIYMTNLLL